MFENLQIDSDDLPRATDVEWEPLDPAYRRARVVVAAAAAAIVALGTGALYLILSTAFASGGVVFPIWWIPLIPPLLGAALIAWPFVAVPRMGYAVRERDLLYRSGVVMRSVTAIPYNRLQHVEKDSSPLDRYFRIANLKLFTAGGAGGDLRIQGLSDEVAERLRSHLLERIGSAVER